MSSKKSWFNGHNEAVKPEDGRDRLAAGAATADDAQKPQRPSGSWFNRTMFLKNITRFWPIWVGYLLLWAMMLPLNLITQSSYMGDDWVMRFANERVLEMVSAIVVTTLIFAVLAAMAVFSYLFNNRSVGMVHALPMRREGLFFTNFLSGYLFLAVPAVVTAILTLLCEAAAGFVNVGAVCMWLTVHLLVAFFFYAFAVFCAMFTGNILAMPAFYGILNGLVIAIYVVVTELLNNFLYGFQRSDGAEGVTLWLTPSARLMGDLRLEREWDEMGNLISMSFQGLFTALVYAFVGAILVVCALLLYRKRHLESAGDVVSVPWVRPVFKYGVGFCAALVGGAVLFALFGYNYRSEGQSLWTLLLWFLPCGALGYFLAEMLLQKSFWVFRRWKGCAVLLAGITLCVAAVRLDVTGFTRWVPDPAQITSVKVWGPSTSPTDNGDGGYKNYEDISPEDITEIIRLQVALNGQRAVWERGLWSDVTDEGGTSVLPNGQGYRYNTAESNYVRLEYTMENGQVIHRRYDVLITEELLADPESHASLLNARVNPAGMAAEAYNFPKADKARLVAADMSFFDMAAGESFGVTVPQEGVEALYAAVQSDMAAGRIGIRYLLNNQERMENCYYNDLTFGFYSPERGDREAEMYTEKYGGNAPRALTAKRETNWQITVTLQTTATDTLAVLERLGVLDEDQTLITQAEYRAWEERRP